MNNTITEEEYLENRRLKTNLRQQIDLDTVLSGDFHSLINRVAEFVNEVITKNPTAIQGDIQREEHFSDEQCFMLSTYIFETYNEYCERMERKKENKLKEFNETKALIQKFDFLSEEKRTEILEALEKTKG